MKSKMYCYIKDLRQKLIELQHRERAAKEETEIYKKQLYEVSFLMLLIRELYKKVIFILTMQVVFLIMPNL